ncbi:MAG: S8 family serine peptidase [Planctomycetes bacterium]|nr:S8 family serine peptidase [Planctomycetota bacterium]
MIVISMGDKRVRTVALAAVAVALGVFGVSGTQAAARDDLPVWAPDVYGGYPTTHILVRLQPDLARVLAASHRDDQIKSTNARRGERRVGSSAGEPPVAMSAMLRDTWTRWRATHIRPLFPGGFRDAALASRHGLDRVFIIEVPRGTDTPSMAAAFALHNAEIEEAGVDAIGGVAACPNLPNDTSLSSQWNMHNTGQLVRGSRGLADADVDAPEAWELHTGEVGEAVIAILDSGVDPHPEFADRMIPGQNVVPGADPDDTSDGCISGHGTHVTGIAAASGNNGMGVAGMTWGANILPVKVLGPPLLGPCDGFVSELAAGIRWAAEWPCNDKGPCEDPRRVDVINMSLQYYGLDFLTISVLNGAISLAHDSGIVLVAATGNNGGATPIAYPAILDNVMAVGATTYEDFRAGISNFGPQIDVTAPGIDVYSTYRNGNYGYLSGTSMATPHVSGLAALIRSLTPERTNDEIVEIILTSTDDLGDRGWDRFFGHGRINAYQALATALGGIVSSSPATCAIDARIPHDPSDDSLRLGWRSFELTFAGEVFDLTPADFAVSTDGAGTAASAVAVVDALSPKTVRVELDAVIEVGAWTTITHKASGTSIRLGFLPGDVNGDGVTNSSDLFVLTDVLKGFGPPLPDSSLDLDRSGQLTPADLLQIIDLFEGIGAFEPYFQATLP